MFCRRPCFEFVPSFDRVLDAEQPREVCEGVSTTGRVRLKPGSCVPSRPRAQTWRERAPNRRSDGSAAAFRAGDDGLLAAQRAGSGHDLATPCGRCPRRHGRAAAAAGRACAREARGREQAGAAACGADQRDRPDEVPDERRDQEAQQAGREAREGHRLQAPVRNASNPRPERTLELDPAFCHAVVLAGSSSSSTPTRRGSRSRTTGSSTTTRSS